MRTCKIHFIIIITLHLLACSVHQAAALDQPAVPEAAQVTILSVTKAPVEKGDCLDLYVVGFVATIDGGLRVPGVLMTGSFLSEDGVGNFAYYDHTSYAPGPFPHNPNGGTESHGVTDSQGLFELRFDVCPNNIFWDANFLVCATKDGYQEKCLAAGFDENHDISQRYFNLALVPGPTSTPSPTNTNGGGFTSTPTATGTPTNTYTETEIPTPTETSVETETPTPTDTPTLSGVSTPTASSTPSPTNTPLSVPTAVHPELDVDGNGVIGPGDLLLLMADWLRPVH
jgi:hypothetical protein